jgi:hypothetical protein
VARSRREEGGQILWVLGVVENEQPSASDAAPQLLEGGRGVFGGIVSCREPQPSGQIRQGQADLQRLFRIYPPDQVVIGLKTMGVFQHQLGLAHAAQAIDGSRQHDRHTITSQIVV